MYRYSKSFLECEAKAATQGLFTDMSVVNGFNASAVAVTADDGNGHKVIRLCDIVPGENAISRAFEGAYIQTICEILGELVPEEYLQAEKQKRAATVKQAAAAPVTAPQPQPRPVPAAVPAQPMPAPVTPAPAPAPVVQMPSRQAPAPAPQPAPAGGSIDFLVKVGPYKAEPKMFSVIVKENPVVLAKLLRVRNPGNTDMIDYQAKANAYIAATGIQLV